MRQIQSPFGLEIPLCLAFFFCVCVCSQNQVQYFQLSITHQVRNYFEIMIWNTERKNTKKTKICLHSNERGFKPQKLVIFNTSKSNTKYIKEGTTFAESNQLLHPRSIPSLTTQSTQVTNITWSTNPFGIQTHKTKSQQKPIRKRNPRNGKCAVREGKGREGRVTKVTTNDAVPGGAMPLVELLLYVLRNVLLHTVLFKCLIESIPTYQTSIWHK